ncbi:uncharacterized protein LOC100742823 isoform X3 [Bombus impatiens]|uniref:Uncharacterized protein LOC100742823 isoform X3 n=1 Tax=Bombus impatiens TaxID=132113 RepID=A0A6P6F875_BOMIM|nr:uncharacterized protein LOC100742823 isoform X3 [Bombus impatiens]
MENATIALDSTVRSQDSSNSKDSKESCASDLKPESCLESKHSKEILISEKQQRQQQPRTQQHPDDRQKLRSTEPKDDSNLLMFTSCGQLLLGVVLVVFGILVLVHGAALGGSGAGLWAGVGALVAGALGVVATLATSSSKTNSSFSTAHLAASLVALALSNMAAITALTAIVRDSQRTPEVTLLTVPDENSEAADVENSWAGLLASIGLLVTSVAELLVSGYSCLTLTPKLCGCLRASNVDEVTNDGRLKTRNMVHQWVTAQNHVPKSQPIYVVQPMLPMHPMIQVRPDPLPRPFVLGYYGSTSGELEVGIVALCNGWRSCKISWRIRACWTIAHSCSSLWCRSYATTHAIRSSSSIANHSTKAETSHNCGTRRHHGKEETD